MALPKAKYSLNCVPIIRSFRYLQNENGKVCETSVTVTSVIFHYIKPCDINIATVPIHQNRLGCVSVLLNKCTL